MRAIPGGSKHLVFHSGETFTMLRGTVMWATRDVDPRIRGTRVERPARRPLT
ncbi:hypothetical protein [Streptomyces marincola]|nr:hypothetical protein [Streptomyces marincola]